MDNFSSVLHDRVFWHTLERTIVFTIVNVGLTMVLGTSIALLLVRVSTWVRVLLTSGLVLVWSMPVVVAVQIWFWMTNFQNGILNHVLTQLHVGDYFQHDWYGTTFSKLAMVTLLIVWGDPVRHDHGLCGPRPGSARARRRGRDRRRGPAARLP